MAHVKYEEVTSWPTKGSEARNSIGRILHFYNGRRPHSSLGRHHALIKPTSLRCRSASQPNPGIGSNLTTWKTRPDNRDHLCTAVHLTL